MPLDYFPTDDEIASREMVMFKTEMKLIHSNLVSNYMKAFNRFWYNENPQVTPAVMAAKLGTKALDVFTKSAQTAAFANMMVENSVVAIIPNEYSFNEDGSINIGAKIIPPEPEPPVPPMNP